MVKKTKRSTRWIKLKPIRVSKYAGVHLLADFWYGKIIEKEKEIKQILIGAVKKANCLPLEIAIHKFEPQGITGVILLEESHISIHTWPEKNFVAVDIYTCGDKAMPEMALDFLKKEFQPQKIKIKRVQRGII